MGQYYTPIIIDGTNAIQTLHAHDFDNGLKLMEHSWVGNEFVNAVLSLIHNKPRIVAWIGDYSNDSYDCEEDIYAKALPYDDFVEYYNAV